LPVWAAISTASHSPIPPRRGSRPTSFASRKIWRPWCAMAPSATTTIENSRPERSRVRIASPTLSTSTGIRSTSAPPETPELSAIHPV